VRVARRVVANQCAIHDGVAIRRAANSPILSDYRRVAPVSEALGRETKRIFARFARKLFARRIEFDFVVELSFAK
jgi:hypothetical protein